MDYEDEWSPPSLRIDLDEMLYEQYVTLVLDDGMESFAKPLCWRGSCLFKEAFS